MKKLFSTSLLVLLFVSLFAQRERSAGERSNLQNTDRMDSRVKPTRSEISDRQPAMALARPVVEHAVKMGVKQAVKREFHNTEQELAARDQLIQEAKDQKEKEKKEKIEKEKADKPEKPQREPAGRNDSLDKADRSGAGRERG